MRLLKITGITVLILAVTILIIGLSSGKEFEVSRSIIIYRASPEVFNYVSHIRNQNNYGVWAKMDPDSEKSYTGSDAAVGFVSRWNSNVKKVGQGEQEIMKIVPQKRIETELRFKKPVETVNYAYLETTAQDENETKVTWTVGGKIEFPMNVMFLFMNMDHMLGKQLDEGLVNLKTILEKP